MDRVADEAVAIHELVKTHPQVRMTTGTRGPTFGTNHIFKKIKMLIERSDPFESQIRLTVCRYVTNVDIIVPFTCFGLDLMALTFTVADLYAISLCSALLPRSAAEIFRDMAYRWHSFVPTPTPSRVASLQANAALSYDQTPGPTGCLRSSFEVVANIARRIPEYQRDLLSILASASSTLFHL